MPTVETKLGQLFIQVAGSDLPIPTMDRLDDAMIEEDLALPAMFALRFHDPQFELIDGDQFALGKEVRLGAADPRGTRKPLLTAEVTAIEVELEQGSPVIVVRGYDRSHRLHRGRKTRTFLKQTDSEIVRRVAQEAGLKAEVQATSERHAYVMQDNQTDMEFLRARAARIGYEVRVDGQSLLFRKAAAAPPDADPQEFGLSLLSFRVRRSVVAQPSEVRVQGWDYKAKRQIVGKATTPATPSKLGDSKSPAEAAKSALSGAAIVTVTDRPVSSQSEANTLAQSVFDELAGDYLAAEGSCLGNPTIRAGSLVEVKGVGKRLSGKYLVSATRHEYTAARGYTTTFIVNGRRPASLLAGLAPEPARRQVDGVVTAIVTNVNDPDKLGRVKLKFPWLDENHESDWARIVLPGGGNDRGLLIAPEVDDEVLVAFDHGDINHPYVVGGLWNGKDKPPASHVQGGKVLTRALKTRAGHTIELQDDDSSGQGFVRIKTKSGHTITVSDNDKQIAVKSQGGHKLVLDDQGRAVKLESTQDLELKCPSGKLAITTGGVELSSSSGSKLALAASGVELSSHAMMKLQANAIFDVKSSAILNIQGTLVKIN